MKKRPLISAVINIHNEAKLLPRCLKSLQNFADEIVVVDMHSTDRGAEIARNFGAKLYPFRPLPVVEPARNFAISKALGKWILVIDPDEYLGPTLKTELLRLIHRHDIDSVKIPRKNIILGRWIRHSRFWPDYLIRFFKRGSLTWPKEIHRQPIPKGNTLTLLDSEKLAIRHRHYQTVSQFILRALRYSHIQADELKTANYQVKVSDFILRPVQEFNSRFFAGEGYKDGIHGLALAILQAFAVCLTYLRLWEKRGIGQNSLSKGSFVSASLEASYEYGYWFFRYFAREYTSNLFKKTVMRIRLLIERLTKNF